MDREPTESPSEPSSLEELLDRLDEAAEDRLRVTLGMILATVGDRSFGPLLLLAGLVTLAPVVGDIPGMPTTMGLLVLLTAVQLLAGREHLWLPGWLLDRSVARAKLDKATDWLRRPARFIDRLMRPRLTVLVRGPGKYLIVLVCVVVAAAMPPMELVPFSANGAGAALTAFGLALIARDGLVALLALLVAGATFWLVVGALP